MASRGGMRAPLPVWALVLTVLAIGCQSDAERARELVEGARGASPVDAQRALAEATRLDPGLREAWSRTADLELEARRWSEAQAAARRAIEISDDAPHDRETEASAAIAVGDWAAAEVALTRAIALAPSASGPSRTRLGDVYEHLARPDDALLSYRAAAAQDPSQVDAQLGAARLLLVRVGRDADAEAWDLDIEDRASIHAYLDAARPLVTATSRSEEFATLVAEVEALDRRAVPGEAQLEVLRLLQMAGDAPAYPLVRIDEVIAPVAD